jgi:MFS family permease
MISALKALRLPAWCRGNITWLLAGRAVRSFTQAALAVAVPLYVAAAGFSTLQVGYLLSIGSLGSIAMVLTIGFVADRYGRRPLLLWIAVLSAVGTAVYAVTTSFWPLAIMGAIASVGRGGAAGSGGNWGPFYPAEQPLIASSCPDSDRNAAFAAISFVGALAAAAGSLVAVLPALLVAHLHMTAVDSFRPLFWICTAGGVALVLLVLPIRERRIPAAHRNAPLSRASASLILRLWLTNGLNGFAFGILGPFLTYWFFVRFGVGAAALGSLYTLINLVTAFPVLGAAWMARRLGAVRSIVLTRVGTVLFLVLMALAPTYLLAAATYVIRMLINSIGMPIRQSFVMGVSEERSRSTVAAIGNLPSQVTSTLSPTVGSYLLAQVSQEAPIWFAAAVLALNGAAFFGFFRGMKPPEEASATAGATGRVSDGSAAR